jgi:hypothetical protein
MGNSDGDEAPGEGPLDRFEKESLSADASRVPRRGPEGASEGTERCC